jgi:hypothetical protein
MWLAETIQLRLQTAKIYLMRSQEAWSLCYSKNVCLYVCYIDSSQEENVNNLMSSDSDSFTWDQEHDDDQRCVCVSIYTHTYIHIINSRGSQIFQKSGCHLKIVATKRMT